MRQFLKQSGIETSRWLGKAGLLVVAMVVGAGIAAYLVLGFEPTQIDALKLAANHTRMDVANMLASERVAYYTKVLAIFTGAVSAFGILQIFFLIRADKIALTNAQAAIAAANAATNAAANADKQTAIASRQADLLEKQKEIQRLQFFAEHRPRLILRDVYPTDATQLDSVSFELSNTGGTPANIVGGFVAFSPVSSPRDFKDPKMWALGTASHATIEPGELAVFQCGAGIGIHGLNDPQQFQPMDGVYFYGVIKYCDDRGEPEAGGGGVVRSMVFRRQWHNGRKQFMKIENPDAEYSD